MVQAESDLVKGLSLVLPPERVLSGSAVRRAYECDAYSVERHHPTAVVLPESTSEVQDVVKWCANAKVPFTARGAGTGLSGGAMPALGGVVVSTKKLNKILEIDVANRCLLAQTGVPNLALTRAVQQHGLHFAPDPSSQSVSTLGGNIAENSGGPHTLKYGVTTQHILGLTTVLASGELLVLGGKAGPDLGYDLASLVIGSEGTLGIVTEAWVRLTPLPRAVETATVCFASVKAASQAVAAVVRAGIVPAALEMIDRFVLDAVASAFTLEFHPDTAAMLLLECDGSPETAHSEMAEALAVCAKFNPVETRLAQDEKERAQLWTARKKGIGAMGRIAPTVVTHDGVIPPSRLPEMLKFVYAVAQRRGLRVGNIFHAGDGNLHPIFCFDDRLHGMIEEVVEAGEEVIRKCLELGGSVSGEHGIGVEKTSLLAEMFDSPSLALQSRIKGVFGAGELCNPCKVVPDAKGCIEHKIRWRGVAT